MAIQSYRDKATRQFHVDGICPAQWRPFERVAVRKFDLLHAATQLSDIGGLPGNRLEALRGDRKGQHSIRINQQWRICFKWTDRGPEDVEIVDYH